VTRPRPARRRLVRLVAATFVAVAGGGLLGLAAVAALHAHRGDPSIDSSNDSYEQLRCVEAELRRSVPRDARVRVASRDELLAADPNLDPTQASYWRQRLTELAYPHLELVADPADAELAIGMAPLGAGPCPGGVGPSVREAP
jgi:hypothetical protein